MKSANFKSGFVGLAGRTNVGKSTLVNRIVNRKVAITSGKAQTTRSKINCILNTENSQVVFIDCPGFFKPRNLMGKHLNNTVSGVIEDADIIVAVVDVAGGIGSGDFFVFEQIKSENKPKFLLLNKIDIVSRKRIEKEKEKLRDYSFFDRTVEISAVTGENVDRFLEFLTEKLPDGPRYFEKNRLTDQPLEKMVSEIVREKLFENLSQELPHSINVSVSSFEEKRNREGKSISVIGCDIYAEKTSQKAIIIGKSGDMLKKVGSEARHELEDLLEKKVFLHLWVKVEKNWTKSELLLDRFGY
ncbi:MAG: GTPase Era [Actinomycetota bacterium]|nr:GTPase Era [Actinomycetota bacterium]